MSKDNDNIITINDDKGFKTFSSFINNKCKELTKDYKESMKYIDTNKKLVGTVVIIEEHHPEFASSISDDEDTNSYIYNYLARVVSYMYNKETNKITVRIKRLNTVGEMNIESKVCTITENIKLYPATDILSNIYKNIETLLSNEDPSLTMNIVKETIDLMVDNSDHIRANVYESNFLRYDRLHLQKLYSHKDNANIILSNIGKVAKITIPKEPITILLTGISYDYRFTGLIIHGTIIHRTEREISYDDTYIIYEPAYSNYKIQILDDNAEEVKNFIETYEFIKRGQK